MNLGSRSRVARRGAANRPGPSGGGPGRSGIKAPGDDRLSRHGHYHGPGGLNGRVRDGNGCGPAGMVAGKAAARRSGRAAAMVRGRSRARRPGRAAGRGAVRLATPGTPAGVVAGMPVRGGRGAWRLASPHPDRGAASGWAGGSGWSSGRLLGPVGCGGRPPCTPGLSTWSSSRSLRTNRAGNLVLEGASRLDAFSAYPVPTWLPGDAPSGTAGTPEVGPPQSSRTRGDAPQVSCAHGR